MMALPPAPYRTMEDAERAYAQAEEDVAGDMGEEAVDEGGWIQIAHYVAMNCVPEVRGEFLRGKGLTEERILINPNWTPS